MLATLAAARLIERASERVQVVVVSHAARLIAALEQQPACNRVVLEKVFGATRLAEAAGAESPAWHWPAR